MDEIINGHNLENLLKDLKKTKEVSDFQNIVQSIFVHCIDLDLNQTGVDEEKLERNIRLIKILDKISIYLFSEFNSPLKKLDNETKIKAMELTALVSDKIGDYLKNVHEQGLTSIKIEQVLFKQLKYFWKSSVSYTLSNNVPNSIVIAKKLYKVLTELKNNHILEREKYDLYTFSYFLLSRQYISNIEEYIENSQLIEIFNCLREFILYGKRDHISTVYNMLDIQLTKSLELYNSTQFWHIRYLKLCIERIINNSVWINLDGTFSEKYIQQLIKSRPPVIELWPNQIEVIKNENGFLRNEDIKRTLVNFPTSGGKSLIAEFAIVKELEKDINKKCFYIVPTNALVYEVTKRLRERFRRLGYKVSSSPSGYELDLLNGNYFEEHIIVTTPEKLDMIIKNNLSEDILSETSLIIFDEFQKIQDRSRGWIIEGSIVFLINHRKFKDIKLMFLSAIIDNGPLILNWVDDKSKSITDYIPDSWKPTTKIKGIAKYEIKKEGGRWAQIPENHKFFKKEYNAFLAQSEISYLLGEKNFNVKLFNFPRYHYKSNRKLVENENLKFENFLMGVAQKLKSLGGSLIFFHTREDCENFVRNYSPFFPEKFQISQEVINLIEYIEKRLGKDHLLVIGLKKGVVYHHGSLPMDIREALEDYYSKGYIQIMVCTTTLVEGVNFPIQNFIHTGKKYQKQRTLTPADFKNIVGRAGRAYQNTFGQIIYIDFYKNIIEEHLYFENYTNNVESSILEDEGIFSSAEELETLENEERDNFITKLTEKNFIKSLLLYYNSLTDKVSDVDILLENTLFAKQIGHEKLHKLSSLSKKVYSFYDTKPRDELIRIQESGLSFTSYKTLALIAKEVIENFQTSGSIELIDILTNESYLKILSLPESVKFKVKKSTPTSKVVEVDDYNLLIDWVESDLTLKELSMKYFNLVETNYQMTRITEYIKDMFEYKLPWVFGVLASLIIEKIGFVGYFANLPAYIKYGINSSVGADLFKLGFNSRETVKDLSGYIQTYTNYETLQELKDYLQAIDPLEFLDEKEKLLPFEVRKLVDLTNNYKDMTDTLGKGKIVETYLAGTKYYLCKLSNIDSVLEELTEGVELKLKRESNNFFDIYATEVYFKDIKIGYVPRKINEEVSYYLDLNTEYLLNIKSIEIVNKSTFINIKLTLSFK